MSNKYIERIKSKFEETDRERAVQEQAHIYSSDYNTPPSTRVASLEGQVLALKWVLEELQKDKPKRRKKKKTSWPQSTWPQD